MKNSNHPTSHNPQQACPPRFSLQSGDKRMVVCAATPMSRVGLLAHIVGYKDNGGPLRGACTGAADCPGCLAGVALVRCPYALMADVRDLKRWVYTVDVPAERDPVTGEVRLAATNSYRVRDFSNLMLTDSPGDVWRMAVVSRDAGTGSRVHLRGLSHEPAQFFPVGFAAELYGLLNSCRDHIANRILEILPAEEYAQHEHIQRLIRHSAILRGSQ